MSVMVVSRMASARRYLRIVRRVTALNLRARMEYRGELALEVVNGIMWQTAIIIFASVLLTRFPGVGGWSSGAILLIVGMRMLSHALYVMVFSNIAKVPFMVINSNVDGYLVRPLPVFTQVLLHSANVNAIGDLLVAVGMLIPAFDRLDVEWTPWRIAFAIVAVISATLLEAAVQTVVACLALRFPGSDTLSIWVNDVMSTFGNYPLNMLPTVVRMALTYVLPVAFIAYLPAAVLSGRVSDVTTPSLLAYLSPLAGVLAFYGANRLWRASLRTYRSPGG